MNIPEQVLAEVMAATTKFPTWPTDPLHAFAVVGEEVGELQKAILQAVYEPHKSNPDDVRAEAIQVAAMAFRFLLSLDEYKYEGGEQHQQGTLTSARQAVFVVDHVGSSYGDGPSNETVIVGHSADVKQLRSGMRLFS